MPKKTSKKVGVKKTAKKASGKHAGRPAGSGKFGCATKAVRIPIHLENAIQDFIYKKIKLDKKSTKK
jgi:hypothetical protein